MGPIVRAATVFGEAESLAIKTAGRSVVGVRSEVVIPGTKGVGMVPKQRGAVVIRSRVQGVVPVESTSKVDPVDLLQSQRDSRSNLNEDFPLHGRREGNEHHNDANNMAPPDVRSDPTIGVVAQSAPLLRLHASDIAM